MMRKIADSILIATSYKCNVNCKYCYAKKSKKVFGEEMSLENFIKVVNLHYRNGGKSIGIIGGEPTLWKFLGEAILYCKLKGIKTTVFTNGVKKIPVAPDFIYLNVSQFFSSKRDKFEKILGFYQKKGVKIILRYNFDQQNFSFSKLEDVIKLSKQGGNINNRIDLVPIAPYKIEKKLGTVVYKAVLTILKNDIEVKLANPLPPCIFSQKERGFLKKNSGYYTRCNLGILPLVNPDGKTVQICSKINSFKSLELFLDKFPANSRSVFKEARSLLENKNNLPFKKCSSCIFFKKRECFGGCLAFK